MSLSNHHPDPEDSLHLPAGQGRELPARAAAAAVTGAGQASLTGHGAAPVSLWVLAACGVAVLIAGGILGSGGRLFSYQGNFRDGYMRRPAPGSAEAAPAPKEAMVAYMTRGEKIYKARCAVCHGPEGKGDNVNFPSLAGSQWATGETQRMAMIVINGLKGPSSTGKTYLAGMPPQSLGMGPEDLAGVMTYVRNHFGNSTGDVVSVAMAKTAFEVSAARANAGQQTTAEELAAEHTKSLPGPALDAKAMVDALTLAPIPGAKP